MFLFSALFLKIADLTFPFFFDEYPTELVPTKRYIVLREHEPNQTLFVAPAEDFMIEPGSLDLKSYIVNLNSDGFVKNGNPDKEITDDPIRIVFLGGSTTESLFVNELNRFPSYVERSLRSLYSQRIKTINAGVAGNNSFHSLLNFQAKVIPKKVHIAVMMHNINDLGLLSKTGSYWLAPESKAIVLSKNEDQSLNLKSILRFIKNIWFPNIYRYVKPRLFPGLLIEDEYSGHRNIKLATYENSIPYVFEQSLRSFISLCEIWGVQPVLMTQFNRISSDAHGFNVWINRNRYESQISTFIKLYESFNETIRKVALDTNTHLIDLDKLVPKSPEYLYDIVHLNDEGSKLVGSIISDELLKILKSHP